MADPFEVRMRFTSQLQHLNASVMSAQRTAHYALKYRDMDEDLHSCILEQLERNDLNNRANIMYFMQHLADTAARENHPEFIRMMSRDILRIVDLVAPDDGSGAANVKVVRKVLDGLAAKAYLSEKTVGEVRECIKDRDTIHQEAGGDEEAEKQNEKISIREHDGNANVKGEQRIKGTSRNGRLDKKQIEQRIEEDRERHKRSRESIWAVGPTDELESARMWEDTSDANEDDRVLAAEEAEERIARASLHRADMLAV